MSTGTTATQIAFLHQQHDSTARLYKEYDFTYDDLKKLLLGAVDNMFIVTIQHHHIGYANVTTLQILAHLYDIYALIHKPRVEDNTIWMTVP